MRAAFLRPWLAGRLAAVAPPAAFAVAVEGEKEDGRLGRRRPRDGDTVSKRLEPARFSPGAAGPFPRLGGLGPTLFTTVPMGRTNPLRGSIVI